MNIVRDALDISIPGAPSIPGFHFRYFRGESDHPGIAAVMTDALQADHIERVETAEEVARFLAHLPNFDPFSDCLIAEINQQMVGFSFTNHWTQNNGRHIYRSSGYLLPEWRRKGIGQAVLRYNEGRLLHNSASRPAGEEACLEAGVYGSESGYIALLEKASYQPVRWFCLMVRPNLENIPVLPLPDGMDIRPVQESEIPAIHAASSEAFRDHWGFSDEAEEPLQAWLDDPKLILALWKVAWCGDEVAGMVLNYIDKAENDAFHRLRGWTENIAVRKPYRRRGLARALIAASLHMLRELGMQEAALGADTENLTGAFKLYESMGFEKIEDYILYQKPILDR